MTTNKPATDTDKWEGDIGFRLFVVERGPDGDKYRVRIWAEVHPSLKKLFGGKKHLIADELAETPSEAFSKAFEALAEVFTGAKS